MAKEGSGERWGEGVGDLRTMQYEHQQKEVEKVYSERRRHKKDKDALSIISRDGKPKEIQCFHAVKTDLHWQNKWKLWEADFH